MRLVYYTVKVYIYGISELTNCLGFTMERILLMESPSDRPSKSINDKEHLYIV